MLWFVEDGVAVSLKTNPFDNDNTKRESKTSFCKLCYYQAKDPRAEMPGPVCCTEHSLFACRTICHNRALLAYS